MRRSLARVKPGDASGRTVKYADSIAVYMSASTLSCAPRTDHILDFDHVSHRDGPLHHGADPWRCCMKDLLRVGRFGPPFSSPQEPHCRDAVEGSSHV